MSDTSSKASSSEHRRLKNRVFPTAEVAVTPRKSVPLSFTNTLNSAVHAVCANSKVHFVLDNDFVDNRSNTVISYSTDLVHLNPRGLSLWWKKIGTFLDLIPVSRKATGQGAAQRHRQRGEPSHVHGVKQNNRQSVEDDTPAARNIPVVTRNRLVVHSSNEFHSRHTQLPLRNALTNDRLLDTSPIQGWNTMHPVPFFPPRSSLPAYPPGQGPHPFAHCYPRPLQAAFENMFWIPPPPPPFLFLWWVTKLPL